jgi:hypothetical protein
MMARNIRFARGKRDVAVAAPHEGREIGGLEALDRAVLGDLERSREIERAALVTCASKAEAFARLPYSTLNRLS